MGGDFFFDFSKFDQFIIEKLIFTTALHYQLNFSLHDDSKGPIFNFLKSLSVSGCSSPVILEDILMENVHLDLVYFSFPCL